MGFALATAVAFQSQPAEAKLLPDLIHYNLQTSVMTNNTVDADARGTIFGLLHGSSRFQNQLLRVTLTKLDANTNYTLVVFTGADTNPVVVTNFTTNVRGSYTAAYWKRSVGAMHRSPLPDVLDPIINIREFQVLDSNGAMVLQAMVVNPNRINYSVRRNMENTGFVPAAVGSLRIHGTHQRTNFRLYATGLAPLTQYMVAINGTVVVTNTSNARGAWTLTKLPAGSPNFIDIKEVALADTAGNVVLITTHLGIPSDYTTQIQGSLALGTAANFAILAGAEVTSTGNTAVTGDLGVWAGTGVSGFAAIVPGGPGTVSGSIHAGDSVAQIAQGDLTTAYNDAAGRTLAPVDVANADLGGRTLAPGLYKSSGTLFLTGDLTLDAQGNANAIFIFQVASSLGTASGSQVILAGGAKAANIFWQVGSSAVLATTTVFKGTIMADQSISLATGANLEGRALARIGSVTLDGNVITLPTP